MSDVRVFADGADLARSMGSSLADLLRRAPRPLNIAIAGGFVASQVLAAVPSDEIDWAGIRVWWVDERFVPDGSPDRNDREAWEALFSRVAGAELRPMPADGGQGIDAARREYQDLWNSEMTGRTLDLALVGMGPDGHYASLFPGHTQLDSTDTVLVELESPKPPPARLTLSRPVIGAATKIWVAAAGEAKASALAAAWRGANYHDVPIAGLVGPRTTWWVDEAAAG